MAATSLGAITATPANVWGPGKTVQQPAIEQPCGGTGQPACPASETLSGGGGGFIPVVPERVLDTPANGAGAALRPGETRTVPLAGVGSVPAENVSAVALSVTASSATFLTALTVWPTGTDRPANPTANVLPGITERALVVVPYGADGSISIFNLVGRTGVTIDLLGWFGGTAEFRALPATQLFSTVTPTKVTPLDAGSTTQVTVLGHGGIPAGGVGAVVLHLTSALSTAWSEVTVWPAGATRPGNPSFVVQPVIARNGLVVVQPGTDGAVSVYNRSGRTQLAIEVVGWIPDTSTYRPVAATTAYAATTRSPLRAAQTVDIQVTGVGGVPAIDDDPQTEDAHSVVLALSASPLTRPTRLTTFTAGTTRPDTTSLAASPLVTPATGLTIVPLSADGKVSLYNADASTAASVVVVGWFATPMAAAQVTVPETTKAAAEEDVASVDVSTNAEGQVTAATVVLDPAAPDVVDGDHLVLGITDDTPEGLLGTVTDVVTNADGSQVVTTTPARLEEVFPEGDIEANLAEVSKAEAARSGIRTVAVAMEDPGTKGTKVEDPFGTKLDGVDPGGHSCSLTGVEVDFGPYVDMQFRVKWHWLSAPTVTALATLGVQASIALKDVAVKCGFKSPTLKYKSVFLVGYVPVVITFDISASLDVEAGLKGLDIGASAHAWVTIGVKDNRGYSDSGWDVTTPDLDDLALQARHLTAYAMADAWLEIKVLLYGVIGPDISVGPFLEAGASTVVHSPPVPWWAVDIGYAAKVKLVLDLWFYEWTPTLWDGEIPLADLLHLVGLLSDCTGDSKSFASGSPCRAPDPGHRINGDSRDTASRIRLASASTGFNALSIGGPFNLAVTTASPVDTVFDVSGFFSSDALIRIADGTSPGLGLAFANTGADGWSSSRHLIGTAPSPGTYTLQLEARYKVEGTEPDPALRAHKLVYVTVQPPIVFGAASSVAGANLHTCARLLDGSVVCWGMNTVGELGDGTMNAHLLPVKVGGGLAGSTALVAGAYHTCAILTGKVFCWGLNSSGQLGNGTTAAAFQPHVVTGITTATAVAAGDEFSCAVLADHTVRCWGSNTDGQLGDGTTTNRLVPVAVPGITTATAIAAGDKHVCALLAAGTVTCWGDNGGGQLGNRSTTDSHSPVAVWDLTGVAQVSAGGGYTCARLAAGGVRCWGANSSGQLGNGTVNSSSSRVTVTGITTAASIGTGSYHACAVLTTGAVRCWGRNADGQLGDSTTTNRSTSVAAIGIANATSITGGMYHTCAMLASGSINCWGDNTGGQLGDGTGVDRLFPVQVLGFSTVPGSPRSVTGTGGNAAVTVSWSAPYDTGGNTLTGYTATASPGGRTCTATGLTCTVTGLANSTAYTFTVTASNQVGTGAPSAPSAAVTPASVAPGRPTGVAATSGNTQATVTWSAPASDGGSAITGYTATALPGGRTCAWVSPPGGALNCTVTGLTNGTAYTFTVTATNVKGTSGASDASAPVTPATVPGAPTAVAAAAFDAAAVVSWVAPASTGGKPVTGYTVVASPGGSTCESAGLSCVVSGLENGTPYTFTVRAVNAVGAGAVSAVTSAVTPRVLAVRAVDGGLGHTCAVLTTGSVMCWGDNASGQLGNGTTDPSMVPALVPGISTATGIAAGDAFSCALLADHTAWCWGSNQNGQLGDGTGASGKRSLVPVKVLNVANATSLAAGNRHACVVRSTGQVSCWGDNASGQLGDGTQAMRTSPVNVANVTAAAVAAGNNHTCSVDATGGQVRCWGANASGQLGTDNASIVLSRSPIVATGVTGATSVAAGDAHTCAVLSSGQVRCWGLNAAGQLGDGSTVTRRTAVAATGISTATQVTAGATHTCVALASGTVACWGSDAAGMTGLVPASIAGLTLVTAVAAGAHHTCAVRGPGWLVCWGDNLKGELGDGSMTTSATPLIVLGFPTPPAAPTDVDATAGEGSATVSWSAPDSDGGQPITGYAVTGDPGGRGCRTSGDRSCVVPGLTNGVAYRFTVTATNAVGTGAPSAPSDPVTPTGPQAVDTRLLAWGDGSLGQLDVPNTSDVVAVSAGARHTLALRSDGTVIAWGDDTDGQATVPAGLSGVVAVSAGDAYSLALRADHTVVAWGRDDLGQATVPSGLANVVAIAAGARHSLALLGDGTVVGWGDDAYGATTAPDGLTDVTAIAAGAGFSLALRADGTVVAWGRNDTGQADVPTELAGIVVAIDAGSAHAVALTADGQVVAWGDDSLGQTDVPGDAWGTTAIAVGTNHTLALRIDGVVTAWGDNALHQADVPAGLTGVLAIAAGGTHSVVVVSRNQVIGFDEACPALVGRPTNVIASASSGLPLTFTATPAAVCSVNATGDLTLLAAGTCSVTASQSGNADWNPAPPVTRQVTVTVPDSPIYSWGDVSACQVSVPAGITDAGDVAAGGMHSLALTGDGHVVGWGDDQAGQATAPAGLENVAAIDAGYMHSLALKDDGTVVAWGANDEGQGSIPAALADDLVGVRAISAGGSHNLAVLGDGTVRAWGSNDFHESDVPAGLTGVSAVSAGMTHSLALKDDGTVVAWGSNDSGEATVPAGLSGVIAISAGKGYSLALRADHTVVAWGDNSQGQATVPTGLSDVSAIAAGGSHALALRSDGSVVTWGGLNPRLAAVPADMGVVTSIDAGEYHSVALGTN